MNKRIAALFLAGTSLFAAKTLSPEASRWWSHVQFLASDELQGRETGSPGYQKAVDYVVSEFRRMNVRPAGENGYQQLVPFRSVRIDEEHSTLALVVDGETRALKLGDDAMFSMRVRPHSAITAPAVFIGYGLKIPELGIDDFKGVDLRGRFAVYLNGAPADVPGPLAAHSRSSAERLKNLVAAGAVGSISFTNPRNVEIPWPRATLARFTPAFFIEDPRASDPEITHIIVNPERVDKLLAVSGHTAGELYELDDAHKPLPRFPLRVSIAADAVYSTDRTQASNVIGVMPGSDPKLASEYVVMSAHLDHVGIGRPINGDNIYNGAMDNASGIAAMLEVAHGLAAAKPKRSVLLVAVTGEEKGLLGSKYFAAHPTVKPESIVADVNLDMFLPIIPLKAATVYGIDESTLGETARAVLADFGVAIEPDREPDKNHFIRSDQYSFILKGVPSISVKFAAPPGTPEDAAIHEWMKNRYHAPSDDLQQSVDIEAAGTFVKVVEAILVRTANAPARPRWASSSFFARFAQ
jgi:hypothetical protein